MQLLPLRLSPGMDLRRTLEDAVAHANADSAFVIAGIGSLVEASIRYADKATESTISGPLEVLSVSGTLSPTGAHLHMVVSDESGRVYGGHVGYGNVIRTTAEVLLAPLQDWALAREFDPATGFNELVVRPRE
jgi:predicted DNA-binding protein with PD1-like motif